MASDDQAPLVNMLMANVRPYGVYLHEKPYDCALIVREGVVVKKISTLHDGFDIDLEVLQSAFLLQADELYKVMACDEGMLNGLVNIGIKSVCIGQEVSHRVATYLECLDIQYRHGFAQAEINTINRFWLKKSFTGTPYIVKFKLVGIDGMPLSTASNSLKLEDLYEFDELLEVFCCIGKIYNVTAIPALSDALDRVSRQRSFPFSVLDESDLVTDSDHCIHEVLGRPELEVGNALLYCENHDNKAGLLSNAVADEFICLTIPCLNGVFRVDRRVWSSLSASLGRSSMLSVNRP